MNYRSRWQQKRQLRVSRQRLIWLAGAGLAIIIAVVVIATRGVDTSVDFRLPGPGICYLTTGPDFLLVTQLEGRLTRLTAAMSDEGSGWARPFTHPAGFRGAAAVGEARAFVGCGDARVRAIELVSGVQAWESIVGASAGPPVVAGDAVFFGADDGYVYAAAAEDGAIRWSAAVGARVPAAPLVTDDSVLVGTTAGIVHCLARSDGKKQWRTTLDGPVYATAREIADGYLVGCDDGHVHKLSREGDLLAIVEMEGIVRAPVGIGGDVVVAGDSAGVICRIEPEVMTTVWRRRLRGCIAVAPIVDADRVYCATGRELVCMTAAQGRVIWRRSTRAPSTDLALAGGHLYWATADGYVCRLALTR